MRKPETFADHLRPREQSQNLQIPLGLQFGINICNIPLIDPYIPGYNWQILDLYHYTYLGRGVQQNNPSQVLYPMSCGRVGYNPGRGVFCCTPIQKHVYWFNPFA